MTEFGYWLSSEEHAPLDLVRDAARAEELGFSFAMISDHFHPWIDAQGESPFVWSVLGGIAQATERLDSRDRRHLPADPDASGDHRPRRRYGRGDAAGPVYARARDGREPERARHRRPLALARRTDRDARGGDRGDPPPLAGRRADLPRQALHGRPCDALHPPRAADPDRRRGVEAARRRAGGTRR